jgi:hypothetical protein
MQQATQKPTPNSSKQALNAINIYASFDHLKKQHRSRQSLALIGEA